MLNFDDQYEIKLRKDCEIHNLYLLNDRLIVMLIYLNKSYYFDIIKDNVKRDLIKINLQPVFIIRVHQNSLGLIINENMQNNTLYIFNANTYCLNKNKLSFKENPTGYMYFSKSDTAIIFANQEDGKLIGFIVDQNESMKKMVYSTDEDQVVNCYQIDQEERFIIKFQNITSSQQSIYLFQFQGSIARIKSAYLEGFVLNGSAKNEEYILLFQTPIVAEPSFIELIDHNYNSVRVIIFLQYNFLYSIEQIYNFDDQNVWCKMTTDLVDETEYLIVFNKHQLTIIDQKCYEQFIPLQIMCSNNILIEQSFNIIERTHLLVQQPQQIIQKYTELIKNLEIFDEQSEIRVHLNINPKFQVYKIMKQAMNIEHSLIEEIFLKMSTN